MSCLQVYETYHILPHLTAHWESSAAICLLSFIDQVAPSNRHIVQDPVMLVVQSHSHFQQVYLFSWILVGTFVGFSAHSFTFNILQEVKPVRAWAYSLSEYHLAEIFNRRLTLVRCTEVKVVIFKWNNRLLCVQSIYVQWDHILWNRLFWSHQKII